MKGAISAPADRRTSTTPIMAPRTRRLHAATGLTSLPAGKMVPIFVAPILREDSIISGRIRCSFESEETAEMLMNPVNVKLSAYLIPTPAFERFENSIDQLNRSWEGKQFKDLPVVPFIETEEYGAHGSNEIYKYLGLHGRPTQKVNTMYLEAYNVLWNWRARNRSEDLYQSEKRERLQKTLAPAFWMHERFKHIVPDFDQASIDGEIAFNVVNERLPVKGINYNVNTDGTNRDKAGLVENVAGRETGGNSKTYNLALSPSRAGTFNIEMEGVKRVGEGANLGFDVREARTALYAEMSGMGISLSLSNIELAKRTAAFAKLRAQYSGHDDDYIIDMLMDGLSIPEAAYTQPILISEKTTVFGMSKRYATDSGNLTENVVSGATFIDMAIRLPRIPVGGVVLMVAEIMPDQLFERQKDPFFHAQTVDDLPHYLRDELDPEKVDIVYNEDVDLDHDQPREVFGYHPLNARYNMEQPRIGGRFFRPKVDQGFNEDRQRIWAVETKNPKLSADFYICKNIHIKPFVVTNRDPFECVTQGTLMIEGLTVFGPQLIEANGDYDAVMAEAPNERIVK